MRNVAHAAPILRTEATVPSITVDGWAKNLEELIAAEMQRQERILKAFRQFPDSHGAFVPAPRDDAADWRTVALSMTKALERLSR